LAKRVAMSPRNFQRVFTSEAGKSPARYVEELRIETARRLLERTTQSMDEIADRCAWQLRCFSPWLYPRSSSDTGRIPGSLSLVGYRKIGLA